MIAAYRALDRRKPAMHKDNEGKTARNVCENDDSNFLQALYNVYKIIRTIFFHTLLAIHRSIASYKYFKNLINK